VRFVVLDAQQRPALALLPADGVVIQGARLDMPGTLLAVSRAAGNLDTPGGMYCHLYVAFVETAPQAQALNDARSVIDCHRFASFCREQEGKLRPAWQHGLDALAFARTLDADPKPASKAAQVERA
jgi:hypothetical protein